MAQQCDRSYEEGKHFDHDQLLSIFATNYKQLLTEEYGKRPNDDASMEAPLQKVQQESMELNKNVMSFSKKNVNKGNVNPLSNQDAFRWKITKTTTVL